MKNKYFKKLIVLVLWTLVMWWGDKWDKVLMSVAVLFLLWFDW